MKVCIAVKGRFHAFNLAQELERQGLLERLITSYPRAITQRFGLPAQRVRSLLSTELVARAWRRAPDALRTRWDLRNALCEHFDRQAESRIPGGADVFVGWSGSTLRTLKRARRLGALGIVERGSSHIETQRDLLRTGYERLGLQPTLPCPKVIERELAEYAEADRIAVPSDFVRTTFLERGFSEHKLLQVPYGVDLREFQAADPAPSETFRILHVGRVDVRKGAPDLMRAFCELDLPNAELDFVGPVHDEMRPFMQRYAHPGIRFHGPRPQSELHEAYARASLFCLASIEEGLAMVVLQAMSCARPVLVTRATGAAGIVRDGVEGRLIESMDLDALKESLEWFYQDRERGVSMGRAAHERVKLGYTWRDYGTRIAAAYHTALHSEHVARSA